VRRLAIDAALLASIHLRSGDLDQACAVGRQAIGYVAHDPADVLAPHAADLAARLRLRAGTLEGALESIATDQRILSEALAHLVRETGRAWIC